MLFELSPVLALPRTVWHCVRFPDLPKGGDTTVFCPRIHPAAVVQQEQNVGTVYAYVCFNILKLQSPSSVHEVLYYSLIRPGRSH